MALSRLVLTEIVRDLVPEQDHPEDRLRRPEPGSGRGPRRCSSARAGSCRTLDPLARPPSWGALTGALEQAGCLTRRRRRMSSSPIVRISLALASYFGLFDSDFMRASRKPSTFWSSIGTAAAGTAEAILGAEVAPTCCTGAGGVQGQGLHGRGERLDGRILDRGLLGHNSFVPLLWAPTRAGLQLPTRTWASHPLDVGAICAVPPTVCRGAFPLLPLRYPCALPSKGHSGPVERAL